jgi:hypothetical protein
MLVNLKFHLLNKIIFSKIIKHVIVKAKQTYIERSSFHWASYLQVNGSRCEGTPLDIVASHSTSLHHKSMFVPQVPILGQHLMTCGRQYRC